MVLTSSCAAIYGDNADLKDTPNGTFTEEIWNTSSSLDHQPYSYSKTVAEQEAWKINKEQSQWDLVVINPSLVLGPAINPNNVTSESFNIVKQFGNGSMKAGAPKTGMGVVDVRDVALAHFNAGYNPRSQWQIHRFRPQLFNTRNGGSTSSKLWHKIPDTEESNAQVVNLAGWPQHK